MIGGHMVRNLTWEGHEFLDSAGNESVWDKTRQFIAEKGGGASFQVLTELLKKMILRQFDLG